jgi:pyruvate kinase
VPSLQKLIVRTGQPIVISAGMPFGTPGTTNLLRIA